MEASKNTNDEKNFISKIKMILSINFYPNIYHSFFLFYEYNHKIIISFQ
jgi:hypothetical protein